MYTEFYGLREKPFSLAPDPAFLFLAPPHREALAHVLYGIDQGEGFIAVTGEVGTGKTTLCRTLLQRLGPDTEVAFVFNPVLSGEELLRAVSLEFGLLVEGRTKLDLHEQLNEFLLEQKRAGHRVLLIVDEAQNLSPETLEEIRLLSNLETSTSKLIQILLFGQPELDDQLDSKRLRQLRQRISVRWNLRPLSAAETQEYVRHRLRIAAGQECNLFSDAALREVRRRARGIPRLVNLLCDRSLLAGYGAGERTIGVEEVGTAAREILGTGRRRRPWRMVGAFVCAGLALVAAGAFAWQQWGHAFDDSAVPAVSTRPPAVEAPPGRAIPVPEQLPVTRAVVSDYERPALASEPEAPVLEPEGEGSG
jgi:general secretion pathway protein A